MIKINTLYFENIEEFITRVIDDLEIFVDEGNYSSVGIIAKYEQARDIIREAVLFGFNISNIELEDKILDNYDKEFGITLTHNNEIWCQKMWHPDNEFHKAGYITGEDAVTYIYSDCNSKALENYDKDNDIIVEFSIGHDCEDCDCQCCNCCHNDEEEVSDNEFDISKDDKIGKFYVNGKEVGRKTFEDSRNEVMKRFDKFDEEFKDVLSDALLLKSSYRHMYNDILRLLW